MIDAALGYARRGWPVFPCRPDSKEPATGHGFLDASTDPHLLRSWWTRQPEANVAIATGAPGPDVLDVDQHGPAGNGFAAWNQLAAAGLTAGAGAVVATPRGGLHAYFTGSSQPCGRLPGQHLDFRGRGGYVLAPPSQVGGKSYRLLRWHTTDGGLDWAAITRLLQPGDRPRPAWRGEVINAGRLAAWVARLPEGNRNCGLYWAACRAVEAGNLGALDDLAAAAARTGLPEREIARTMESARRSARQRPSAA